MATAYHMETAFMRGLAKDGLASEIGFSPAAESQMSGLVIIWPDVYQVLRQGRVIWSDKEDADGAKSIMVGTCCDGERLRLTLVWSFAPARVLVASVERI
jgi:hypothetical protein